MIMNEAGMSAEKRQSSRVQTSIPVRYRELRDGAEVVSVGTLTSDVSTGGLRFGTNKFISNACRLMLELDIPTLTKPITALSKVIWTQKVDARDDCQYQVGNQFMEITKKDQELIATYLKSL
ncbi:MAG: hypothetical protein C0390_06700 [Syntrophus sp. (in: bacteria)]|nr:hypothetical protein [Syntrophus sp. (in: bacteria)]